MRALVRSMTGEMTVTQVRATLRCKTLLLLVVGIAVGKKMFLHTRWEMKESIFFYGGSTAPFIAALVLFP